MDTVRGIHPDLEPYVRALVTHEFGLLAAQAEVRDIEYGGIVSNRNHKWGDRFYLKLPYCKTMITWQVLMCSDNLKEPPDFIMEDNFLADTPAHVIKSKVPSLVNWQPSNPKCLLNVVLELLQLYKNFQGSLLQINPRSRYYFEYDALVNKMQISPSYLELYVYNPSRVTFLIHLQIDFSKLPPPLPEQDVLTVLYIELIDNTKNCVSLIKRKALDIVFGDIDLPELKSDMMLIEYIPLVTCFLEAKVNDYVSRLHQRRQLYSYLVQHFEPAILNGDNIHFRNISFLLEKNGSYYVVLIIIPLFFPDEQPIINISTIDKREYIAISFDRQNFAYNPEWSIQRIFETVYEFIKDKATLPFSRFKSKRKDT